MLRASRDAQEEQQTARKSSSRAESQLPPGSQVFSPEPTPNLNRPVLNMAGVPMPRNSADQRPADVPHSYNLASQSLGCNMQAMPQVVPLEDPQQHHQQR